MVKIKEILSGRYSLETLENSYENFKTLSVENIDNEKISKLDYMFTDEFSKMYHFFYCKDFNLILAKNVENNYTFVLDEDEFLTPLRFNQEQLLMKDIIS